MMKSVGDHICLTDMLGENQLSANTGAGLYELGEFYAVVGKHWSWALVRIALWAEAAILADRSASGGQLV